MSCKSPVADMRDEVALAQLVAERFGVIGFVCANMLNRRLHWRSGQDGMLKQVHQDQMVVNVGWRNLNGQRRSALIHPQMAF